jgi:lipopolysaccharide/colanic/teichoic acid biosynthesis glycosyltransferase
MLEFQAERCNSTQAGRFAVRPGLTGWAQINGRNALSWPERIELDLDYVARQSLFFDIKVLFYTAPALVMGGGVEGHQTNDPFVLAPDDPEGQADA